MGNERNDQTRFPRSIKSAGTGHQPCADPQPDWEYHAQGNLKFAATLYSRNSSCAASPTTSMLERGCPDADA